DRCGEAEGVFVAAHASALLCDATSVLMYSRRASCQRRRVIPILAALLLARVERAGLRTGGPESAWVAASTGTSSPVRLNTSSAHSLREHSPALVRWYVPYAPVSVSLTIAAARSSVSVGEAISSMTARSLPSSCAFLRIFSGKLWRPGPYSQLVRTM